jgi:hypothetical protein
MRTANLSKPLYGLFIFFSAICLFPLFPQVSIGASLFDLVGTWDYNRLVSGPAAPWWERGTLTIKQDGTFTGSGKDSNGSPDSLSGAFSISSDGILMTGGGCKDAPLCQTDSGKTVLVCTHISGDGSSNLTIFTRQAASYSMADLAGNWEANFLSSGPTSWWARMRDTTYPNGTYKGTIASSDGSSTGTSGQIAISPTGVITCHTGGCLSSPNNFAAFMAANKTVSVGTSGAASGQDALFSVFTRQAASYSMADLAGTWQGGSLASGPGAPYWGRDTVAIDVDGTFTDSWTGSDGSSGAGRGTLSISSDGVITCVSGDCADRIYMSFMDAGKTVMAGTHTWQDGATREIQIFTKDPVPNAPTGVTATAGDAHAAVSFNAATSDGGSPIQSYLVTSYPGGKTAMGLSSPITVGGLTSGGTYTFRVAATNAKGTGPMSAPSNIVTLNLAAPLTVTIEPSAAITAGAKWNVDGGAWQSSGTMVEGLSIGSHKVAFKAVTGWTTPADQTVKIVNGKPASASGVYVEQTGSLKITITPDAAASAGAEWNVDGGAWQKSGATVGKIPVGSHKVAFKTVAGWTTPADQTVKIVNGKTTSASGVYVEQTGSLKVTITPAAAVSAGAEWNVDGGAWQKSGATVGKIPVGSGSHKVAFKDITGWNTPAGKTVKILNGKTTSASGVYVKQTGSLKVTITPDAAVSAGAKWNVDNGRWQVSGTTLSGIAVGSHVVNYAPIVGWTWPGSEPVTISNDKTTSATGSYKLKSGGSLTVTISPAAAVTAGAKWNVDEGQWQDSGATVDNLSKGSHIVNFKDIPGGWTTPADQSVNIQSGKTATATGNYERAVQVSGQTGDNLANGCCNGSWPDSTWECEPPTPGSKPDPPLKYTFSINGVASGPVGSILSYGLGTAALTPYQPFTANCGNWHVYNQTQCIRGQDDPDLTNYSIQGLVDGNGSNGSCASIQTTVWAEVVAPAVNGKIIATGQVPLQNQNGTGTVTCFVGYPDTCQ